MKRCTENWYLAISLHLSRRSRYVTCQVPDVWMTTNQKRHLMALFQTPLILFIFSTPPFFPKRNALKNIKVMVTRKATQSKRP